MSGRGGYYREAIRGSVRIVREDRIQPDDSRASIYFLLAAGANLIKIGWVRDRDKIDQRIEALQTGCPWPLIVQFMLTPMSKVDEKRLHTIFIDHWHFGEWFRCEGALKEFLQRSAVFPEEAAEQIFERLRRTSA